MDGSSAQDDNVLTMAHATPEQEPSIPSIEQVFAKLKALLRTAAARTVTDLWAAIRQAFTCFTATECRNYLAAAGYDAYDPT